MKKKLFIVVVIALFIITPVALIANSTKNKNVDCAVGEFGNFSVCSNTCGGGTQTRSRRVITPKSGNGKECPELSESRPCNTQVCPVDCKVSDFTIGECSQPCGGGTQTRTRTIIQNQVGTGAPCPPLSDTIACNIQPCPVDCKVSDFSDFSDCTRPCGGGTQTRTRIQNQVRTGAPRPPLLNTIACNTESCQLLDILSPSGTIIEVGATIPGSCSQEAGGDFAFREIGILGLSGIMTSVTLSANISWGRGQNVRVGVYLMTRDGASFQLIGNRIAEFVDINQTTMSIERPVFPFRFDSGDKIGVFLDRSFCEGAVIRNPRVLIRYASV